jgi:DNA-binding CsgD family transcriptional regulator
VFKTATFSLIIAYLCVFLMHSCKDNIDIAGLSEEQEANLLLAEQYFDEGNQLHLEGQYFECAEPFLRCKKIIEDNNLQNQLVYSLLCDRLGHTFFYFRDFARTKYYLLEWYKYPHDSIFTPENVFNTLGLTYNRLGDYDSANIFFDLGIEKAKDRNAIEWIGLISGNKASNLRAQGKTEDVLDLYLTDYEYSLKGNNTISAAIVMISIAEYYAEKDDWIEVENALDESMRLFAKTEHQLPHNYFTTRGKLLAKKNDCEGAIFNATRGAFIKDSLAQLRDKTQIKSLEFTLFTEEKAIEIESLENDKKKAFRISWITLASFIGFIIFILVFIKQEKAKTKKDRSILEYRERLVKEELKNTKENLSRLMSGLNERNEIIQKLEIEIETLNKQSENDEILAKKELLNEQLQNYRLLTEDDWTNFKKIFNQLHPAFLENLMLKNPAITNAEIRIACLIRLNLSTSEIANTLGISNDSARKTNLRLRNKLSLGTQEELIDYLFSIKA